MRSVHLVREQISTTSNIAIGQEMRVLRPVLPLVDDITAPLFGDVLLQIEKAGSHH